MKVRVEADGGSRGNPGPSGYGAVVLDPVTRAVLRECAAAIGVATNNVAEYGGLIAGLPAARELGADEVEVRMDSKLVVEQMSGRWQVKHPSMKPLAQQALALVREFASVDFGWIPRAQNSLADALANAAMDAAEKGQVWQENTLAAVTSKSAAPNRLSGWQDEPGQPITTLLLRHGQTALSVDKRFSGIGDPVLTELGRGQAAAAAARLGKRGGIDAVICSPLLRARATAEAVAGVLGLPVLVEPDLRETDFGDWEGSTFGEVKRGWPAELDAWLADSAVPPPGGESFDATAVRVWAARDRIAAAHLGQTVLLVSHVTPIKQLLRKALDAPSSALYRMHLDLACLSEVQWFSDGPAVVRSLNDTAHLTD